MKRPVRVAVTGAAGQIGYSLVFRIAAGEMLGQDQPVILQLLELPLDKAQAALKGVMMELEDCALPLLAGMAGTADPKVAFKDVDMAILVGARPRGPGMERKDLLLENAKIFIEQGRALDAVASRNVKILGVGNPANTNAYIAMKSAPSLPKRNFTAMLRLDHNRALSQLAQKSGKPVGSIEKLVVWGNPSPTMYPDYRFATADGASIKAQLRAVSGGLSTTGTVIHGGQWATALTTLAAGTAVNWEGSSGSENLNATNDPAVGSYEIWGVNSTFKITRLAFFGESLIQPAPPQLSTYQARSVQNGFVFQVQAVAISRRT